MQITDRYRMNGFSGFGALSSEQEIAVSQAIESLETDLGKALINVASTTATWDAGNVKDAVLKNLQTDSARIQRLKGELLDQVRSGSLSWGKWIAIAELTHEDIAYQQGLSGEWSLSGVLRNTVGTTIDDIQVAAEKVIETAKSPWTKVIVVGVLGMIGYFYLRPFIGAATSIRKKFQEYEPEDRLDGYRRKVRK